MLSLATHQCIFYMHLYYLKKAGSNHDNLKINVAVELGFSNQTREIDQLHGTLFKKFSGCY